MANIFTDTLFGMHLVRSIPSGDMPAPDQIYRRIAEVTEMDPIIMWDLYGEQPKEPLPDLMPYNYLYWTALSSHCFRDIEIEVAWDSLQRKSPDLALCFKEMRDAGVHHIDPFSPGLFEFIRLAERTITEEIHNEASGKNIRLALASSRMAVAVFGPSSMESNVGELISWMLDMNAAGIVLRLDPLRPDCMAMNNLFMEDYEFE